MKLKILTFLLPLTLFWGCSQKTAYPQIEGTYIPKKIVYTPPLNKKRLLSSVKKTADYVFEDLFKKYKYLEKKKYNDMMRYIYKEKGF